jgi:hypothetical protein
VNIDLASKLVAVALIAWAHIRVERRGRERDARWRALARAKGAWTSGPAALEVRVVSQDGGPVNLGTSVETTESLGSDAVLTCDGLTVQVVDGPKLALRRGAKLEVKGIAGAERKFVRAVTTEDSAQLEYSYLLAPERTLWLIGALPRDLSGHEQGPFRGEVLGEIEPLGGAYKLSAKPPDRWISGCGTPLALIAATLTAPAALAGYTVAFWLSFALVLLALGGQYITVPDEPPSTTPEPERVRAAPNDERDEHALDAVEAATPEAQSKLNS